MIRSISKVPTGPSPEAATEAAGLTLDCLCGPGNDGEAKVDGVEGTPALRRRLLEAGFTAGSPVRFLMATPFGDPLVFSLRGAVIALRKSEARCVRVRF
jgi:ferrous iron transport protein A